MTRFARAKGSKASNERVPENPTSWNVMKEDLQKSQEEEKHKIARDKMNKIRQENYKQFVDKNESNTKSKWSEFPKPNFTKVNRRSNKGKDALKITEADVTDEMIEEMLLPDPEVDAQVSIMTKNIEKVLKREKFDKRANKRNANDLLDLKTEDSDDAPEEASTKIERKLIQIKKPKNRKNILKIPSVIKNDNGDNIKNESKEAENQTVGNKKVEQKNKNKREKHKKFEKNQNNKFNKNNKGQKQKIAKERDNNVHVRRKEESKDMSIVVNGEIKELVYFDGFPILKSDSERLIALKKTLISKGIPRGEVQVTMKLERRKAEKLLSRLKKLTCYQCRRIGHMLSECPELKSDNESKLVDNVATGICFKCGSTEHKSNECKVNKEFNFAKCFICREQGHIARQCPDNARGLYPKGGACKLCGDVTHLKKDCPKYHEEQKNNSIVLDTISNENIESLDVKTVNKKFSPEKKNVIKF